MHCCVPLCKNTADNAAGADEVTFHGFPLDAKLRMKWLRALGIHGQPLKDSAVVCSQHFLHNDFCNIEGASRQVFAGVISSEVKVTIEHLKQKNDTTELLKSENVKTVFAPDHYGDVHTNSGNIVLSDVNYAVKIEPCECTLDESDIGLKLEETSEDKADLNDEPQDTTACINNISDASILFDMTPMDKPQSKELDFDVTIKLERSDDSDDADNSPNNDTRHAECGSKECDTQLAHRTHTALHSQHRDTNQVRALDTSADDPHTSVKLVPIQLYELHREKKNRMKTKALSKNCIIEPHPKGDELELTKNHTIDERLSCSSCGRICKSKSSLASHIKVHSIKKPFSCKLCAYTSKIKGNLVNHMSIHSGEKPYSCKVCEYVCRTKGYLVAHMRIHTGEKPFSCKFCDYVCRLKGHLVTHMRIHTGEKPFSCKFCKYACRSKGDLVKHIRIHTGEKPFSCKFCEYVCRTKGYLVTHMRIHTDEKPFSCKFCEYACRSKGHLVTHMRIHTGEKPFSCKFCEYACKTKGSLIRHTRIHTGEKPLSCKSCEYACRTKGDLVRHMKIHTRNV